MFSFRFISSIIILCFVLCLYSTNSAFELDFNKVNVFENIPNHNGDITESFSSMEEESCVVEYDTVEVGLRDTVDFVIEGSASSSSICMNRTDLSSSLLIDENFIAVGRYYEHHMYLYGFSSGEYNCEIEYLDGEVFRRVFLTIRVQRLLHYPEFYGCPDTLLIVLPGEIKFLYLEAEDPQRDRLSIELVEYPEPYEEFWSFRFEDHGYSADMYFQFYPSIYDTGMYIFRVEADNGRTEECLFIVYVTKDTSDLCPYTDPETLYFDYLEGNSYDQEITLYDNYGFHHWHIETDCDSIICAYPNQGTGTGTSTILPECKLNSIDVVFAIDTSGSMGSEYYTLRSSVSRLIVRAHDSMINVRYGIITFADGCNVTDFDDILPGNNMTSDGLACIHKLNSMSVYGGGDGPECSLDAIALAINEYDWNPDAIHHIIMITDAPYHERGDETDYAMYTDVEVRDMIVDNNIILSIFEESYDDRSSVAYEYFADTSGGQHYSSTSYIDLAYDFIIDLLEEYSSPIDYLTEGTYECNLTYVIDYPITCRSIDVPIIMHVYDTSETYQIYNCPEDTLYISTNSCDTVEINTEYFVCDSPYVNLIDYPIDHVEMWSFETNETDNEINAYFVFMPEDGDSGIYHYCIEYGNEFGSDTCSYNVHVVPQLPFYHFFEGWNLLSYPFSEPNTELITLNPDSVRPYTWNSEDSYYAMPDEITEAMGFWLYANNEMYYNVYETPISSISTTIYRGWNLLSSTGDTLDIGYITEYREIIPPVVRYNTNTGRYEPASEILPGIGYWLMSTETFEITYPE